MGQRERALRAVKGHALGQGASLEPSESRASWCS